MGGVIVVVEVIGVIAHPVSAHGVEGRSRRESGQVHLSIKERHYVRCVSVCVMNVTIVQ